MVEGRWLPDAFGLSLNQREVDFVVPRLDSDIRLCIDPFLLYKSNRDYLRDAHGLLLTLFTEAFDAFRKGDEARARELIDFPEVVEIRFGYAQGSIRGSGMGPTFSGIVMETLRNSPHLVERGLRHVEELQLFSVGIAQDRISDLAANVLRSFLLDYTRQQAEMWDIPVEEGVPVEHIWDPDLGRWRDSYETLPVDPETKTGILLVPRWIVRGLPWINYDDYLRNDLSTFLRARLGPRRGNSAIPKARAVEITHQHLDLVDKYVDRKESEGAAARPDVPPLLLTAPDPEGTQLLDELGSLDPGHAGAHEYQRLVLRLLNSLLEPELVDGEEQVRTVSGVEIRDLVYSNNSDMPFLRFLLNNHGNLLVVFECKNVEGVDADDINQLANYLGDPMGYCGFICCRNPVGDRMLAKARATYNKGSPHRAILFLTDDDFRIMMEMKRGGSRHPVDYLQRRYREFVQSLE